MSATSAAGPLLRVEGLCVDVVTRHQTVRLVHSASLQVDAGELVGVVGQSGAGKSMTAWSVLRLLDPPIQATEGSVVFGGTDLATLSERDIRRLRGGRLSAVVQDPRGGLDPTRTVGTQLRSVQTRHQPGLSRHRATERSAEILETLGLERRSGILDAYPHQLSGGMAQRVMLAVALVNNPSLLVADEPTSGLDATLQLEIMQEIRTRVVDDGLAVLIVTHELGLVANFCDRVYVMADGHVVESGVVAAVLADPQSEETKRLIAGSRDREEVG